MVKNVPALELFLPNNLSRSGIDLMKVDARVNAQVRDVMRRSFGYSDLVSIQAIGNAGILSANYFVTTTELGLIVKARPGVGRVARRLEKEAALTKQLLALGIPVPCALASSNGRYVVEAFGSSWGCFRHVLGNYFQGRPGELLAAARGFAALSAALRESAPLPGAAADEGALVEDLGEMVRATPIPPRYDETMAVLYSAHRNALLGVIDRVLKARLMIESCTQVMHTDYHPLNILLQEGQLTAILDFEDIKSYPVAAASGFAAYKLIRQALVSVPATERIREARDLVALWIMECSSHLPDLSLSVRVLGEGALYRVLGLLQRMFDAWLRKRDTRFNFDFLKQMGSLYEIEMIFNLDL